MNPQEIERFCALQHEAIDRRFEEQNQRLEAMGERIDKLAAPIEEMRAGLKALRWLGMLMAGLVIFVKTGDVSAALKSMLDK